MKIYIAQIFIVKLLIEMFVFVRVGIAPLLWMITTVILVFPIAHMSALQDKYPKPLNKRSKK